jgi:hypothetical protein
VRFRFPLTSIFSLCHSLDKMNMTQLDGGLLDLINGSPVATLALVVPKVWCETGNACWRVPDEARVVNDLSRAFFDFVALKRASQVTGFVERYGLLYLCAAHGFYAMHNRPKLCPPHYRGAGTQMVLFEPIERVLAWAEQARALIALSEKAKKGTPVAADEWHQAGIVLMGEFAPTGERIQPAASHTSGADSLRCIQGIVNVWLSIAAPRPFFALKGGRRLEMVFASGDFSVSPPPALGAAAPQIVGGGLLWAALALQMASVISGGAGLATCSACGTLYQPTRMPVPGRNTFCSQCGKRAAWRIAKRRERNG